MIANPHADIPGGPYLLTAVFCEKVLRETDGVMSLIRVVNRFTVTGSSEEMPLTAINVTACVTFASGTYRGSGRILIQPISPSAQRLAQIAFPVSFEGDDDRGVGVIGQLAFPATEPGVYWFEIRVEGNPVATRIPMRIVYHRAAQMTAA